MFSSDLEQTISRSYKSAREARHESLTLTHLALALLDMPDVIEAIEAGQASVPALRGQLSDRSKREATTLPTMGDQDTQPSEAFQRTLQRAVYWRQVAKTGPKTVSGVDVLSALLKEKDSDCVAIFEQSKIDSNILATHAGFSPSQQLDPQQITNKPNATIRASTEQILTESPLENAIGERLDLLLQRLSVIEARLTAIEKKLPGQ